MKELMIALEDADHFTISRLAYDGEMTVEEYVVKLLTFNANLTRSVVKGTRFESRYILAEREGEDMDHA